MTPAKPAANPPMNAILVCSGAAAAPLLLVDFASLWLDDVGVQIFEAPDTAELAAGQALA